jgi:hypothetical protein
MQSLLFDGIVTHDFENAPASHHNTNNPRGGAPVKT